MILIEEIYAQATLLAGSLTEQEAELLKLLCQAAAQSLENSLREDLTVEDCSGEFVAAASLYALAALREAGQDGGIEEFKAGDLTVKRGGTEASARCLQRQAEQIIRACLKDRFIFLGV